MNISTLFTFYLFLAPHHFLFDFFRCVVPSACHGWPSSYHNLYEYAVHHPGKFVENQQPRKKTKPQIVQVKQNTIHTKCTQISSHGESLNRYRYSSSTHVLLSQLLKWKSAQNKLRSHRVKQHLNFLLIYTTPYCLLLDCIHVHYHIITGFVSRILV